MPISRRFFLTTLTALVALPKATMAQSDGIHEVPLPNKSALQSGDLIWPKKPGAFVPYHSGQRNSYKEEQQRWNNERNNFLDSLKSRPSHLTPSQIQELRGLDFREFYARYAGDQKPNVPGAYSSTSGIYVGHVGLIEVDDAGIPWVVEALWNDGVIRHEYDEWIRKRPSEVVWHGRLRDLDKEQRALVVSEAKKHISKPYNFWNFNLNDDSSFYCSKLVWLSVFRSLGFPVDGNNNSERGFWFSPKQLLYTKTIARLHDPGPYSIS